MLLKKMTHKRTVLEQVKAAHSQAVQEEAQIRDEIVALTDRLNDAHQTSAETGRLVQALGGIVGTNNE